MLIVTYFVDLQPTDGSWSSFLWVLELRGMLPTLWLIFDHFPLAPEYGRHLDVISKSFPAKGSRKPYALTGVRTRDQINWLLSALWSKTLILQIQKVRLRKKKWFVQGHTARTWGEWGLLCTHKVTPFDTTKVETQLTWNLTKNMDKMQNFSLTMKSVYAPSERKCLEVLTTPPKRRHEVRGSSVSRSCPRWSGGWGDCICQWRRFQTLLLERNKPLAIFWDQREVSLTLTSHLCCFPSAKQEPLFKFTSVQG